MPYSPPLRTSSVSLVLAFLYSSCQLLAHAKTVSRIIDDTYGDEATGTLPVYYPHDSWVWRQNCNSAQGCDIVPDEVDKIQNRTWTAATYRTNMTDIGLTLQFEGTAISVYFILTNDIGKSPTTRNTECNFTLDGTSPYLFTRQPTPERGFEYNYEVYKATGLENKRHTLDITTGQLNHQAYTNFDYARYTTEIPDDPNSTDTGSNPSNTTAAEKKRTSVGVIVGAVVGGVSLLCILGFAVLVLRRERKGRSSSHPHDLMPEPYSCDQPLEMNQIETVRKQLRNLQARERGSVQGSGSEDSQSALLEQIRQMQSQLDSLQNQSRFQSSIDPSEPPPSYLQHDHYI